MICFENGKKLEEFDLNWVFQNLTAEIDKTYICCISLADFKKLDMQPDHKAKAIEEFNKNTIAKLANHDNHDLLYIDIPEQLEYLNSVQGFSCYISKNILFIIYQPWGKYDNIETLIENNIKKSFAPGKSLLYLLDLFSKQDFKALQKVEEEITDMEEMLLSEDKKDLAKDIAVFRKLLLGYKSYYEQMFGLFESLIDNGNSIFTEDELLYCGNLMGRATRLQHTVLNLRDYVTQVREAYQSQVDISLNTTMRVFTVFAAIFLPLMFITSWYGMNMPMPEIGMKVTYYIVIGICAAIMVSCFIYFRKKKWF